MTDKEVIKALECCVDWCGNVSCWDCPLKNTGCIHFDKLKETLDLINRQKSEIERLKYCNETNISSIATLHERLKTAKAEAIKEFAERLKEKNRGKTSGCVGWIDFDDIDNLLKEMVGDNDE